MVVQLLKPTHLHCCTIVCAPLKGNAVLDTQGVVDVRQEPVGNQETREEAEQAEALIVEVGTTKAAAAGEKHEVEASQVVSVGMGKQTKAKTAEKEGTVYAGGISIVAGGSALDFLNKENSASKCEFNPGLRGDSLGTDRVVNGRRFPAKEFMPTSVGELRAMYDAGYG